MNLPKPWWTELPPQARPTFQIAKWIKECYFASPALLERAWFEVYQRPLDAPLERMCLTPKCANPFHHREKIKGKLQKPKAIIVQIDPDHVELLEHIMDMYNPKTYQDLRKHIPVEDVDDDHLIPILNESYKHLVP